jgi:hypothetical protein
VLANAGLTAADPLSEPHSFAGLTKGIGADAALLGRLAWVERDLGWIADWQLTTQISHSWRIRTPTFDAAFRNGIAGSARLLSGHGAPPP